MSRAWVLALALVLPDFALAEGGLPALYDVSGVAADDVLNIRAKPDAGADAVGALPPDAQSVEVIGFSEDGKWAQVNSDDSAAEPTTGYVASRFLTRRAGADWQELQGGLRCLGTEPFWGLTLNFKAGSAELSTPDPQPKTLAMTTRWPGSPFSAAAVSLHGPDAHGMAVMRQQICSDGMADTAYGIAVDLFLQDPSGSNQMSFSGCCTIAP